MLTITDPTGPGTAPTFADVPPKGIFKIGAKHYQRAAAGTTAWCFEDCAQVSLSPSDVVAQRAAELVVS